MARAIGLLPRCCTCRTTLLRVPLFWSSWAARLLTGKQRYGEEFLGVCCWAYSCCSSRVGCMRGRMNSEASPCPCCCSRNNCPPLWASSWVLQYRSEEHTSELQSLMRISYAVFCLKKN